MLKATCFDNEYNIIDSDIEYLLSAKKIRATIRNPHLNIALSKEEKDVLKIFTSPYERTIIESLLLCDDAEIDEIMRILELEEEVVAMYISIFFSPKKRIGKRISLIGYIEDGLEKAKESNDAELINFFLFKKWVITLGKEFIFWKFSLIPQDMSTETLYNTVIKEAYFYHKEKSLSDQNIPTSEYLKSTNTLLSGLKTREDIAGVNKSDSTADFLDNLDIIIEERTLEQTLDDKKEDVFVNNIDILGKDDRVEIE